MGISTDYNYTYFRAISDESYDYIATEQTGCNAYSESNDDRGQWRVPSNTDLRDAMAYLIPKGDFPDGWVYEQVSIPSNRLDSSTTGSSPTGEIMRVTAYSKFANWSVPVWGINNSVLEKHACRCVK